MQCTKYPFVTYLEEVMVEKLLDNSLFFSYLNIAIEFSQSKNQFSFLQAIFIKK